VIAHYERSFSPDPAVATAHALVFIAAHHAHGVRCSLKHFPGHGSSVGDSHFGLTEVTSTWQPVELEPYRLLIAAGMADSIMTAHVFNATIDPDDPATLSQATISGMLRSELGYGGLVIADDLQMGAITQHYGFETAIRKAVLAGIDILIIANNTAIYDPEVVPRTVAIIAQMVSDGTIRPERIAQSYRRIVALK
jgi:beta-N-acetylhexosaminidase